MKTKTLLGVAVMTVLVATVCVGAPAFGAPVAHTRAVHTRAVHTRATRATVAGVARVGTTTTVTTLNPTVASGAAARFLAQVTPTAVSPAKITGAVNWQLRNSHGKQVDCSRISTFRRTGQSICAIDRGVLRGNGSPISVVAVYTGSSSYKGSSGTATQIVIARGTRMSISFPNPPTSGAGTEVVATAVGGSGTAMVLGHTTFIVISGRSRRGVSANCIGTKSPATANNTKPVLAGQATCWLPAGWLVLPKKAGLPPFTKWSITATYDGNGSFGPSTSTRRGTIRAS